MEKLKLPEVWLRGPVDGIIAYLQPVAHALMQAREEVLQMMESFPGEYTWYRPAGMASAAFHLQHMAGVQDRLFTYAKGNSLTRDQLDYLSLEGKFTEQAPKLTDLVRHFDEQTQTILQGLHDIKEHELIEPRMVGRQKMPSTVLGLLFHAAEHTQRHTGQLLVTCGYCIEQSIKKTKTSI